jgi:RNA polymerase sigma factor (sigma-70 family)
LHAYFALQHAHPLHAQSGSQPQVGAHRQPFFSSALQLHWDRLHFEQGHRLVSFMTASLFLEHVRCSPLLTHVSLWHYTRMSMDDADPVEPAISAEIVDKLVGNHRQFLGFLERRLGSREDAEDILQAAFVKGIERGDSVRDGESGVAWFYRMLRNAVVDHHRRRGAAGRAMDAFARELDEAVEPAADVVKSVCACVRSLSDTLKPEYGDAIRRIDVEGMSVQSYAAEIGIAPNNAAVRVHRAREALRKRVKASCGTCADHGCLDCTCDKACAPVPEERR